MMETVLDALSWGLVSAGAALLVVGGTGLIRLPDFYARTHAGGVTDTLATWCLILGLLLQSPEWIVVAKLLFILLFLFFTSPVSSHALVRSAFTTGLHPQRLERRIDPRLFEGERVAANHDDSGGGPSTS